MMMVVLMKMMRMMMAPLPKQNFLWSVQALVGARGVLLFAGAGHSGLAGAPVKPPFG